MMLRRLLAALLAAVLAPLLVVTPAGAQIVRLKDIVRVQGVTNNQLIGYGLVTGLAQTGDSQTAIFSSQTLQNVLQTFGLSTTTSNVRTRNVAAVMVTATLPPFAHSGDTIDVTVSSIGDSTSLQGGTLILTELRGANNLVYATAQGPISVGGFLYGNGNNVLAQNHVAAGRVPQGGVIARDMITSLQQDPQGFSYVLTTPDYETAAHTAGALNAKFGPGTARALDGETVRVNFPAKYVGDTVGFLADAGELRVDASPQAKVVINERTGTIVMGGDIALAPVAIAHGNLSITISTQNQVVQPGPFTNAQSQVQTNTQISATESGHKLIYITGAATLVQVVRALNTIGVSPRDLISIIQALRESGALQADIDII